MTRTVKTHADHEGVHVTIYEGEEQLASAYVFARTAGGWEPAKQQAIAEARRKLDAAAEYGPRPADETFPLEGATVTELHGA